MLGVTRLLCGTATSEDALRYGRQSKILPPHLLHYSADKRPVVVWNVTRRCNLYCVHCYASARDREFPGELTTEEGLALIDDLADFGVPVVLFSGGEPLLRQDLFQLVERTVQRGVRAVISTNGTRIDRETARRMKAAGVSYVGVSLDGLEPTHDRFRGKRGAFRESLRGIRHLQDAGVRVGLRFTLTGFNLQDLDGIFALIESESIPRCCFYHLAYGGRGNLIVKYDVSCEETRRAVDLIFDRALDFHRRGIEKEILTVDNHADAAYLYLRVCRDQPERADEVLQLLRWNGGNGSGLAIGDIDNLGNVHPDQFWWHYTVGNVRQRKFSEIWADSSEPLLGALRSRRNRIKGRCTACRFFDICNGNLRVRAESYYKDLWMEDPACYLTDEEIGLHGAPHGQVEQATSTEAVLPRKD